MGRGSLRYRLRSMVLRALGHGDVWRELEATKLRVLLVERDLEDLRDRWDEVERNSVPLPRMRTEPWRPS